MLTNNDKTYPEMRDELVQAIEARDTTWMRHRLLQDTNRDLNTLSDTKLGNNIVVGFLGGCALYYYFFAPPEDEMPTYNDIFFWVLSGVAGSVATVASPLYSYSSLHSKYSTYLSEKNEALGRYNQLANTTNNPILGTILQYATDNNEQPNTTPETPVANLPPSPTFRCG